MSRWRKWIGDAGAEELLKETIKAGLVFRAIKPNQLYPCECGYNGTGKRDSFPHRCTSVMIVLEQRIVESCQGKRNRTSPELQSQN
jgi:hypothetical protein